MNYKVLISREKIQSRVKELGDMISRHYENKNPLLIGILKGAFIFMADLSRAISIPHTVDFMAVSSYGSSTTTSGVVRILKDLDSPLSHRHAIIVEDIVDSGLTLNYIKRLLMARSPDSLSVCALLDKRTKKIECGPIEFTGFEIPNYFVLGYGLDLDQQYRNLQDIVYFSEGASE